MDYSHLQSLYESERNACGKMLENLAQQKQQVFTRMADVKDEYCKSLQNLGIKKGAKVRVDFPEDKRQFKSTIYGYIEEVTISEIYGNVILTVALPGRMGQRLKRPNLAGTYTGINPKWVTILPDDYIFGAN